MGSGTSILVLFESWLERVASSFFEFWGRYRVGILGTIAINLAVVIALLSLELSSRAYLYESIVMLDFEREYEIREPEEQAPPPPALPADALDPNLEWEAIRNIALDATREDLNPGLTDEKSIDADNLYQEALRVRQQMEANRAMWEEAQGVDELDIPNIEQKTIDPDDIGQYDGPTVISYFLKGRRAVRLPVPSYKCEGGGQVVVEIEVGPDGRVVRAWVDTASSVQDDCITQAATAAARVSRFNALAGAEARQRGSITYLFVPQY